MKQNIDPKVFVIIIAVALVVFGVIAFRAFTGPSASPASDAHKGPMAPGPGPTAADKQRIRDYYAAHPEAGPLPPTAR